MVEKIEKPQPQSQISDEDLLEQVRLAAERQAAKFVPQIDQKTSSEPVRTDIQGAAAMSPDKKPATKDTKSKKDGLLGVHAKDDSEGSERQGKARVKGRRRKTSGDRGKKNDLPKSQKPIDSTIPLADTETPSVASGDFTGMMDTGGFVNYLNPQKTGKENPLIAAQEKMDALAKGETPDVAKRASEPAIAVSERPSETFDETVEALRARVDAARHEYLEEDYENTNRWLKVTNFFRGIKQEKSADTEYYQAQYNNALIDLRNAELEKIKQSGLEGKELHEALAGTLRYFKYDEAVSVIQERTQVRTERQGFPGKAVEMLEAAGRAYNRLSFEKKILLTAVLAGVAVAAGAAGSAATGAAAALMMIKRTAASAGLAVGTEALLENFGDRRRMAKTDKEIKEQLASLEEISPEQQFLNLEKMLEADIFYSDTRLQQVKRASSYRKLGAATLGIAVGSGWLSQIVMEKLGGSGAADWIKERFETVPDAAETPDAVAPVTAEPYTETPSVSATESAASKFQDILNGQYEVKQGDSVWKILGARVEGLEGAQKTYFIDALKDKVGDIRLEAGEKIDFSEYLTQEEIEKAFAEAQGLSPDKIASIAANDLKIAEFAAAHPDATLTNENVDALLQGKADAIAPTSPDVSVAAEAIKSPEAPDLTEMSPPAALSPESLAQYGGRVDDWYMQIFRMENAALGQDWVFNKEAIGGMKLRDILQDARLFQQGSLSGYATGLDREQITNFAEFFQGATKESVGFDRIAFFKEYPNATVMDYLNRVAPLVNQGQRIGLYTTTH